ncbi:MFS general substrate transporter [Fomitopsis serialis]|uniref:MFS general substrate transporter n=1 Tax=Fomitopsis serialis TaxID=139415 RepID=UPI0020077AD5|nr:MFS general substrate transporter [Neoantrodia serialis]KAH9910536.1 MFS general substrate transporter [Neoantrodia serialis]
MVATSSQLPAAAMSPESDKDIEEARIEDPNTEGTRFQAALGERARRRQFFSRLDTEVADAVNKDAETVEFTADEEKTVRRKIDRRVLSLVIGSYLFNQFDRTNIGNVHTVAAFNENYGVTNNNKWTLALSVFYIGYCLLEMPANVLQRRIGANRFFFMSLTWWGLSSLSFVYAKSYTGLLILRVLLGIGEAGYYAGMVYYLSFWYKRHELAMRISICMTGTYPGAISGLIAFGLLRVHTSVLKGWQFLFLLEAIPTIIMASLLLVFLPSFPFTASFLTPRQRAIAQARLNRDQKPTSHGGMGAFRAFTLVVSDLNAWLLMVIYCGFNVGTATITYFLPTLIVELGFSGIDAQGMTVAPYFAGWFLVVFQAWHSDRTRDRGWHVMLSTAIAFIGYLILATSVQKSVGAGYFALFLVVGGNFSLFPLVMSWAANCFSPTPKRGVGTAFIVSIANCISIAAPQIYFDNNDDYRKGHAISAGCLFASMLAAFILRTRLARKNKKNGVRLQAMTQDEKTELSEEPEIADTDPRYVFMV